MGESVVCRAAIYLIGSHHNTFNKLPGTTVPAAIRLL